MESEYTSVILALVLGWILSEGSHVLRYRGERKKATRVALAELLEVRHAVIGNKYIFDTLQEKFQLSDPDLLQIKSALPSLLQSDPECSIRLNSAISEVAKYNPFLAFMIRGKDIINTVEMVLSPKEPQGELFANYLLSTQKELRDSVIPAIDAAIISTAWHSGIVDWLRAVNKIKWRPQINNDARSTIDGLLSSMEDRLMVHSSDKANKAPQETPKNAPGF